MCSSDLYLILSYLILSYLILSYLILSISLSFSSDGRSKLTQILMSSSNQNQHKHSNDECLSPKSPLSQTYMEPLLPLPPFDLSVLKLARAGTALKKMTVHDSNPRVKGRKKIVSKGSSIGGLPTSFVASNRKATFITGTNTAVVNPSLWSKFAREVNSGIATDHSSDDLSDF